MGDSRLLEMEEGEISDAEARNRALVAVSCSSREEALASYMEKKLCNSSPSPTSCCIFKVPKALKDYHRKAYEPLVVSIGPFHHGNENLRFMQKVKCWYLQSLLSRISRYGVTMKSLVKSVGELEKYARDCYGESIDHIDEDTFVEMLIVDGCFMIELFRKAKFFVETDPNDPVFNMSSLQPHVRHDLSILENQLPWFILKRIFILTKSPQNRNLSLWKLVTAFFGFPETSMVPFPSEILHVLDLKWCNITASFGQDVEEAEGEVKAIPCIRELVKHGVEFEQGKKRNLLKVEFKDGKFVIPPLRINEMTEASLLNLVAFEQLYHSRPQKVTSYAMLMGRLINTKEDVHYLRKKDIISLWVSEKEAASMFDRICYDTQAYRSFYYAKVCEDVKEYIEKRRHAWKAILRNEYFDNPWTSLLCIAAFTLLALVLVQSVCAVKEAWKF